MQQKAEAYRTSGQGRQSGGGAAVAMFITTEN
jgi:hypothetical protein